MIKKTIQFVEQKTGIYLHPRLVLYLRIIGILLIIFLLSVVFHFWYKSQVVPPELETVWSQAKE
jgi:hypothetical protein